MKTLITATLNQKARKVSDMRTVRSIIARALLGIAVTALLLSPAAFVTHSRAAQSNESFTQFWARFKTALTKDDRQAVASMTKLRTGDATYLTDEEFLAK